MAKMFLNLTDTEQEEVLNFCITTAYQANGKQGGAETQTIDAMKKIIRKYFPRIGAETVVSSFEKGSLGMLGEFYGLNAKTFSQWLAAGYNGEYHQRDFDKEPPSRPDTEQDEINHLCLLAQRFSEGRVMYADWRREYNYLVIRHQFGVEKYLDFMEAAKIKASTESKLPILQIGKCNIITTAMEIVVIKWLEQHPNPSGTLSPLIDEKSYRLFRTEF